MTAAWLCHLVPQAYCLYRQGKLQDALSALQSVPAERELAKLQLEAQARTGLQCSVVLLCSPYGACSRCLLRELARSQLEH